MLQLTKLPIMQNTVATGAFMFLTDLPLESLETAMKRTLRQEETRKLSKPTSKPRARAMSMRRRIGKA